MSKVRIKPCRVYEIETVSGVSLGTFSLESEWHNMTNFRGERGEITVWNFKPEPPAGLLGFIDGDTRWPQTVDVTLASPDLLLDIHNASKDAVSDEVLQAWGNGP